ncbi:hypothetical protein ACHQM5_004002 [Ranunculus cassubicifolius]
MPNSSGAAGSDDGASSGSGSNGSNGGGGSVALKKGPWTAAEDAILIEYVRKHGEGNWNAVQKNSGLSRCGKSCRLRWANHLRPNLKKGSFSPEEERLILELHAKLGNKWARMAAQLPGRTDNEIKNYWNTRVKRRQRAGLPLYPQDIQKQTSSFHLQNNNHHHRHHSHNPSSSISSMALSNQQTKHSFIPPLSQFDPMSFSTSTPLLTQHNNNNSHYLPMHGFKRLRGNSMGFNNQPFSLHSPTLPQSSSLYSSPNFSSPMQQTQSFNPQYDTNTFDFTSSSIMHHSFDTSGLITPGSNFTVKQELPSNQMSQQENHTNTRDNSGLLDALLQEAEAMGGREQSQPRQEGLMQHHSHEDKGGGGGLEDFLNHHTTSNSVFNDNQARPQLGSGGQWDDASSAHSSAGGEMKKESTLDMNASVDDDDLTTLLNSIPSTMMVSDLYNEGAETSNGQSSVTDEDIGLDMQHLPSVTAAATTSAMDDWSLGAWNNLPGMSC